MRPFTVSGTVAAPREQVFEYLADLANRPVFMDHFVRDFRLARVDSYGAGASARYRWGCACRPQWVEAEITELRAPQRIVERARTGRIGRNRLRTQYVLEAPGEEATVVKVTVSTVPGARADVIREALGARRRLKRWHAQALRRLSRVVERGRGGSSGERPTVAGLSGSSDPFESREV